MSGKDFHSTVRINFPSSNEAWIMKSVLEVDEELQPQRLSRTFEIEGNQLIM
jgi:hypothetical protein